MHIFYASRFLRDYKKLPEQIKIAAEGREQLFRDNPFNSILKTHKLRGRLGGLWAFSVDFKYRVVFEFESGDKVILHAVGDHEVYD